MSDCIHNYPRVRIRSHAISTAYDDLNKCSAIIMFRRTFRILHMSVIRERRHTDPNWIRAPSFGLVIVVPHSAENFAICAWILRVILTSVKTSYPFHACVVERPLHRSKIGPMRSNHYHSQSRLRNIAAYVIHCYTWCDVAGKDLYRCGRRYCFKSLVWITTKFHNYITE